MAGSSGIAGAWFERLAKYNEESLERITKARDDIRNNEYDFKDLVKDLLDWSEDTANLWMPLAGSSTVPAAVIVMKDDQTQASIQRPLAVVPPDDGEPTSTDLGDGNGHLIAAEHVEVGWENGQRGRLALSVIDLQAPPAVGYYTGAVFVADELIATVHVRVIKAG